MWDLLNSLIVPAPSQQHLHSSTHAQQANHTSSMQPTPPNPNQPAQNPTTPSSQPSSHNTSTPADDVPHFEIYTYDEWLTARKAARATHSHSTSTSNDSPQSSTAATSTDSAQSPIAALHELCQKHRLPLPVASYTPTADGFTACVALGSRAFATGSSFRSKRLAKEDVCRVAVEAMQARVRDEGCNAKNGGEEKDTGEKSATSELHEECQKRKLAKPAVEYDGVNGSFEACVKTGDVAGRGKGGTKKEAREKACEQALEALMRHGDGGETKQSDANEQNERPKGTSYAKRAAELAAELGMAPPQYEYTGTEGSYWTVSAHVNGGGGGVEEVARVEGVFGRGKAKEECARRAAEWLKGEEGRRLKVLEGMG